MKLYMQSLGCAKNQVDSEMILGVLNYETELVDSPENADLIIINTCAFIEPARKEAIDTIFEMVEYKKNNKAKLVVCGCLPQRYKAEIVKLIPEVDRFVTIDEYAEIGQIINSLMSANFHFSTSMSPLNKVLSNSSIFTFNLSASFKFSS